MLLHSPPTRVCIPHAKTWDLCPCLPILYFLLFDAPFSPVITFLYFLYCLPLPSMLAPLPLFHFLSAYVFLSCLSHTFFCLRCVASPPNLSVFISRATHEQRRPLPWLNIGQGSLELCDASDRRYPCSYRVSSEAQAPASFPAAVNCRWDVAVADSSCGCEREFVLSHAA